MAQLANYDYQLKYRPGREHTNADVLSRLPVIGAGGPGATPPTEVEEELLVGVVEAPGSSTIDVPDSWGWDPRRWRELQGRNKDLVVIRSGLVKGSLPQATERQAQMVTLRLLRGHWERLCLKEGVICRYVQDPATRELVYQVVVPED